MFCPQCGAKIIKTDSQLNIGQKIKIYSISVIFAPFGLYWFFKYYRSAEKSKRQLAYIVLCITIVVVVFSVVTGVYTLKAFRSYMDSSNYSELMNSI